MMVVASNVAGMFDDARELQRAARQCVADGDIRNGAERAWLAARMATNALILARSGWLPEKIIDTSRELNVLASQDDAVRDIVDRYYTRLGQLHEECFSLGLCDPVSETEGRIKRTACYIDDVERLAHSAGLFCTGQKE